MSKICVCLIAAGLLLCRIANGAAVFELYGTFHSMGVIIDIDATDDPDGDATAAVEYRVATEAAYQQGFPLTRVSGTRFVGSLFWLNPGTDYLVRVTLTDPDHTALDGIVLSQTGSTRQEVSVPPAQNTYYVSPMGSDTSPGDGSTSYPFATVARALQDAQAGDHVVLREGVYYQGEITLSGANSAEAPIVIRGYDGETAILDGADPATFAWALVSAGVYQTTVNASDPHLITHNGQRLFPYESLSDLQNLVWGMPGFYVDSGTQVYLHLMGGIDPNTQTIVVSGLNHAFYVQGSHYCFVNLSFRNFGLGSYPKGIYIDGGDDNLIHGCTFGVNDSSVGIKRDSHRNVIQHCEFFDTKANWNWDGVKTTGGLEAGAIVLFSPMTGRGTIIRRNTFHDFFDGFGCNAESGSDRTCETDVYENYVHHCGDDALEADGYSSNIRIWDNRIHDVLAGISLAPTYTGPTYCIRNVIYRTGVGNNSYSGLSFKFNSGYDASGMMYLFHNTCDAWYAGNNALAVMSPGSWAGIVARNNIWSGTDYAIYNANPTQPIDLDYDNLVNTPADELVWWSGLADRHLETLAEVQSAISQELNGFNLPPKFRSAASGNYRLQASSFLIDKGLLIPGINHDYYGSGPDLGAYEYHNYTNANHWQFWP
ncbi:hypothetical protein JXA32_14140 [Candidatus Sumerlaeota bacterium]|nr:hypothetical protein [Candidatus Sumerlaeota bacterium]